MKNYVLANRRELEKFNYVQVADPNTNYWVNFHFRKMKDYEAKFGDKFNLIIIGDKEIEGDFYSIPYWLVKQMFTEQHLYRSPRERWVASVQFHQLKVRKNNRTIDVGSYYGILEQPEYNEAKTGEASEQQGDYSIENRKLEVNARQKQSVFRAKVLSNFGYRCCLSDIAEQNFLIASHIVPWAERIESRLDPSNGLCLSYIYDKLFDDGYFSLGNDLHIIISKRAPELSKGIQDILAPIDGTKIREPKIYPISNEYLEYHRLNKLRR